MTKTNNHLKLEPLKETILSKFDNGERAGSIAKELGEYQQAVSNLIKAYRPGVSQSMQGSADFRYFEHIDSPIKAYFLGFIAGDGSLVESKQSKCVTLTITIKNNDRAVLERLREELRMTRELYEIESKGHVRLVLSNPELAGDLNRLGILPRKSLSMGNIIPLINEEFRGSMILGYFDADGSICVRKVGNSIKQSIQIRATDDFISGILEEIKPASFSVSHHDSIPSLVISSRSEVLSFSEKMYRNCPFYLQRKHEKFNLIPK